MAAGGARLDGPGYFYAPTVLAGLRNGVRIVDEEQFGPALPVIAYNDLDEAVAAADGTPFGLTASVWSSDLDRAAAVAARLDCGQVCVNAHGAGLRPDLPFGGHKSSGLGVENGRWGLETFTETQVLVTLPRRPAEDGGAAADGATSGPQPELVDQRAAGRVVVTQRVRGPPATVEREHQLASKGPPQWVLGGQLVQQANHLTVPTEPELRLDERLEAFEAALVEPGRIAVDNYAAADAVQCRPMPQPQSLFQEFHRLGVVIFLSQFLAFIRRWKM